MSTSKRREMSKKDAVGLGKVATTSKKIQNDDPLPFLKKPSNNFKFGSRSATQVTQQARKRGAASPIDKIFQREKREEVDLTIGFFFFLNFISFNVAQSPLFLEMCRALIDPAPIRYVPLNSEKLRTTLLVKAKKEVDKILQPIKSTWPSTGVSIVSDGWIDATRHPLINFMVSSLNGAVFLKAVDARGKYKDAQYMGELFMKVIEDVGVDSCVQIIRLLA
jgi:hypothetical protein